MKKYIGLIIQGPLISYGRTGETVDIPASKVKDTDIVSYDCRINLDKIIDSYGHLFDEIILSTWNDNIEYYNNKIKVIKIKHEIIPDILSKNHKAQNKYTQQNNMLRQYIGTNIGINSFELKIDYLVKIRTDQFLQLDHIVNWLLNNKDEHKIGVPHRYKNEIYLSDFYFAGRYDLLKEYYNILSDKGTFGKIIISENPHLNGIIKYAYEKFYNIINLPTEYYSNKKTYELAYIYIFMMNYAFISLPFIVYENLNWRGKNLTNAHLIHIKDICLQTPLVHVGNIEESGKYLIIKIWTKIKNYLFKYLKY
jgi:hypothetical protein